jgi:hypothetical protein
VGVGTDVPGSTFHVGANSNIGGSPSGDGFHVYRYAGYTNLQLNEFSGGLIDFARSGEDYRGRILYDSSSNYFSFSTNSSEKMRISSDGYLGIGTTSPTDRLQVSGNITPDGDLAGSLGSSTLRFLNLFSQNVFATSSLVTNASTTGFFAVTGTSTLATTTITSLTTTNFYFTNASSTGGATIPTLFGALINTSELVVTNATTTNLTLSGYLRDSANASGTLGQVLWSTGTSTLWVSTSTLGLSSGSGVTGGQIGYMARFISPTALATSSLFDNGTVLGINATSSTVTFNIQGTSTQNPLSISSSSGNPMFTFNSFGGLLFGTSTSANPNIFLNGGTTTNSVIPSNLIAIGNQALEYTSISTANLYNIAIGYQALFGSSTSLMNGVENIAIGYRSLFSNTGGINNVGLGSNVLGSNKNGGTNVALGQESMRYTDSSYNVAQGYQALYGSSTSLSSGNYNIAFGYQPLFSNTSGTYNNAQGYNALYSNTTGTDNVALGQYALYSNTTGAFNIAQGYQPLRYARTSYNVALGYQSLFGSSTSLMSGGYNFAVGYQSLWANTSGNNNIGLGYEALHFNTVGTDNIALGQNSFLTNASGSNNIALGYQAGYGGGIFTNEQSVQDTYSGFIGYQASRDAVVSSTTILTNAWAIGKNARVAQSNAIILGGTSTDAVTVGIGTTSPSATLTVRGGGITNPFTVASSSGATLFSIIANGNIGIGSSTPSQGLVVAVATTTIRNIIPESTLTYDIGASSSRFNNVWTNTINLGSSTWSLTQSSNGRLSIFDQPGATGTERLTILSNGSVGFGSSSPSATFSVAGSAAFGSSITASSFSGSGSGLTGTAASLTAGALSSMNISQFSNNSGYITDGNTNWDNAYGYITSGNTGWSNVYGFVTDPGGITRTGICHADAVFTNGFYTGGSSNGAGACADGDIAENYGTDDHVERGDIVILSEENTVSREYNITNPSEGESTSTKYTITTANVKKATIEKRSRIIGAIPTSPYMIGTEDKIATSSNPEPVALVGHVPIKMTLDGGDIAIGDPITISSTTPGKGMKAVTSGRIIGYALEPYTATSTSIDNMIEVYIKPDDYVVGNEQEILTKITSLIDNDPSIPDTLKITGRFESYTATTSTSTDIFRLLTDVGGVANVKFRIDSDGDIFTDGSVTIGTPADIAEAYPAQESDILPGMLVAFTTSSTTWSPTGSYTDGNTYTLAGIVKATSSSSVIGVVSTNPGITLGKDVPNATPVAFMGRIPVLVTNEHGSIEVGDLLTLSTSTPGVATKLTTSGTSIGRALSAYTSTTTTFATSSILLYVDIKDTTLTLASIEGLSSATTTFSTSTPVSPLAIITNALRDGVSVVTDFVTVKITALYAYVDTLFAREVRAEEVCLKKSDGNNICFNGDQLDSLLKSNNSSSTTLPTTNTTNEQSSTTPDTSISTPSTSTSTESFAGDTGTTTDATSTTP